MQAYDILKIISHGLHRLLTGEPIFLLIACVIILAAIAAVLSRNLVRSAIGLLACFCSIALLYFGLGVYFIGISQILIYAVGITLIVIFAIMIISDLAEADIPADFSLSAKAFRITAGIVSSLIFLLMSFSLLASEIEFASLSQLIGQLKAHAGNKGFEIWSLGETLMTEQLLSFELISIALLIAFVSAILIARRKEGDNA